MAIFKSKKEKSFLEPKADDIKNCIDYVISPAVSTSMGHWLSDDDFDSVVETVYESLPIDFKKSIENLSIVVENEPLSPYAERIAPNTELLGLYVGIPLTKRSINSYGYANSPDIVYIFKNPIQRVSHSRDELLDRIRSTVLHEIGHYFGIDDARLHELGY